MKNEQRRKNILKKLKLSNEPISATVFADAFSVTRQIIVADIALLRASGYPIRSEHRGYFLEKSDKNEILKRIVVKHGSDEVKDELFTIIDNGAKVIDVIIDHTIYGKISAELNLSSRYDVEKFIQQLDNTGANPLSILTEGLHIHTISIKDPESFERIVEQLKNLNILIDFD